MNPVVVLLQLPAFSSDGLLGVHACMARCRDDAMQHAASCSLMQRTAEDAPYTCTAARHLYTSMIRRSAAL